MASEAKLRANKKYLDTQDEVRIRMPPGKLGAVKARAKELGLSVNAYINKLIDFDLQT